MGVGGVAELAADAVVFVVAGDFVPVAGHHRAAGAKALAVAGRTVVELVLVGDFEIYRCGRGGSGGGLRGGFCCVL